MKVIKLFIIYVLATIAPTSSFAAGSPQNIKVVVFGDSLVSGYQLEDEYSFKNTLERKLKEENFHNISLYNGSSDGQATNIAYSRIDTVIRLKPNIVIIALGSNDAFNNVPLQQIQNYLDAIIQKFHNYKIRVLLAGVKMPEGAKEEYRKKMEGMYNFFQRKYKLILYPNLLEGVYGNPDNVLEDGVHPNEQGTKVMVDNVFPHLRKLLSREIRDCVRKKRMEKDC